MRTPRMPGPSAEEQAMTMRQRKALDKEIAENEARLKRMTSGRAGKGSLLGMAGMDDELGGGARGAGAIRSTLFGAGDKGVPGGRTITPGFIKSKTTGQTLKVPTGPGGRGQAAAARFKRQHGVGGDGGMRRTRGR
jgi:hypothetical protein